MKIRNGVIAFSALSLFVGTVVGCATEAVVVDPPDDGVVLDSSTPDTGKVDSSKPDTGRPDTSTPDTGRPDTSTPDSTTADAADAAPTTRPGDPFDPLAPKPGDMCPAGVQVNDVISRRCGKCGTQSALCDTGRIVGAYGACSNEKTNADACLPGEVIVSECGFCGYQVKRCDNTCAYTEGACLNQVAGGCTKGEVTYIEGLCGPATVPPSAPTDVRKQTCSQTCQKGTPEACAPRPLDELVASPTPGTVVTGEFGYFGTKEKKLVVGNCPATLGTVDANVHYARIKNNGAQAINVTVLHKAPTGTTSIPDMLVTTYAGTNKPADRTACTGVVQDEPQALNFNIPAGGSVVFHSMQDSGSGTKIKLEVHTNYVGAGPQPLVLPAGAGAKVSAAVVPTAGMTLARLSASACPTTTTSSNTTYAYIEVQNPGATARTVDLFTADGQDTVMGVYAGNMAPADEPSRLACVGSVNDTCLSANDPKGEADSCLTGVSIPANSSIMVYVAHYFTTGTAPTILEVVTKN